MIAAPRDPRRDPLTLRDFVRPVPPLVSPWDFRASAPALYLRVKRFNRGLFHRVPAPASEVIKPLSAHDRWFVYFAYSPAGTLAPAQRFTLQRLREMGVRVFVVLAADSPGCIADEVRSLCDALTWKALPGYDFSAYALALRTVAERSPQATAFVLNDSVYGPFRDLRPFVDHNPWDLLGFTASSLLENHIQSYAFALRDVTPARLDALLAVLPAASAYRDAWDAIECQETRLAAVASRTMRVGACWYGQAPQVPDPTLSLPLELVGAGFPFLKRSIVGGKHHQVFQPHAQDALRDLLSQMKHPL